MGGRLSRLLPRRRWAEVFPVTPAVSVPAGVAAMPIPRFVMLTVIGSGIWNAVFIGLGWYLQENYEVLDKWLGPVSYVTLGLIAGGLGWVIVRRLRSSDSQVSTKPSR